MTYNENPTVFDETIWLTIERQEWGRTITTHIRGPVTAEMLIGAKIVRLAKEKHD